MGDKPITAIVPTFLVRSVAFPGSKQRTKDRPPPKKDPPITRARKAAPLTAAAALTPGTHHKQAPKTVRRPQTAAQRRASMRNIKKARAALKK